MSKVSREGAQAPIEALRHTIESFFEEIGDLSTLGEFLEILSLSVPDSQELAAEIPFPLLFKAK